MGKRLTHLPFGVNVKMPKDWPGRDDEIGFDKQDLPNVVERLQTEGSIKGCPIFLQFTCYTFIRRTVNLEMNKAFGNRSTAQGIFF